MFARVLTGSVVVCGLIAAFGDGVAEAQDPWADHVISYDQGKGAAPGYTDPATVTGEPERFTGEVGGWPGAITPFNPAWGTDEIVSLGEGGHLIVKFDEPITNDAGHLYGVDLLIFGNGSFVDGSYPSGVVSGILEEGPFTVSVSADGAKFVRLGGTYHDALFPALGYLDLPGPYAQKPGNVRSDFTRPVNPALTLNEFQGKTFAEVVALYEGSGGGLPLDIGPTGLNEVFYVRIDVLASASSPEFDAFAAVPEPSSALLLGLVGLAGALRRGRWPGMRMRPLGGVVARGVADL